MHSQAHPRAAMARPARPTPFATVDRWQFVTVELPLRHRHESWASSNPSGLWLSTAATRTPLHNDAADSLLVQLAGAKVVLLLPAPPTVTATAGSGAPGWLLRSLLAGRWGGGNPAAVWGGDHDHGSWTMGGGGSWQAVLLRWLLIGLEGRTARLNPGDALYMPAFTCVPP
jgi:hypothetical protein